MEERAGYIGEDGRYHFDKISMQEHRAWESKQKIGARFVTLIKKESPAREQSQINAHFERCTVIGRDEEVSATKRTVSDMLLEMALNETQNPKFGKYITIRGRSQFEPGSVAELDKSEMWELKRQAYEMTRELNEDREPERYILLPERGAGSVILKWCALWSERPAEDDEKK